jgi:Protein of function (DUF2518)
MFSTAQIIVYAQYLGLATIVLALFTLVALWRQWGFRFRLVGITGFTGVLTVGLLGLGLGLYQRPAVSGAIAYQRIFDQSGDQAVITVPATITETELTATLRQAAADLYSSGRSSETGLLTIRARTVLHPQPGISLPLYLGQVKRSLAGRDGAMDIEVYPQNLAQLPAPIVSPPQS